MARGGGGGGEGVRWEGGGEGVVRRYGAEGAEGGGEVRVEGVRVGDCVGW